MGHNYRGHNYIGHTYVGPTNLLPSIHQPFCVHATVPAPRIAHTILTNMSENLYVMMVNMHTCNTPSSRAQPHVLRRRHPRSTCQTHCLRVRVCARARVHTCVRVSVRACVRAYVRVCMWYGLWNREGVGYKTEVRSSMGGSSAMRDSAECFTCPLPRYCYS